MSMRELVPPVAAYFAAANSLNARALSECFTDDAIVRDERQEWRGPVAIRNWAEQANEKYQPQVALLDVTDAPDECLVLGQVSGTFPGSPIELRHRFVLRNGKISQLDIG